jgi:hypothetical protein
MFQLYCRCQLVAIITSLQFLLPAIQTIFFFGAAKIKSHLFRPQPQNFHNAEITGYTVFQNAKSKTNIFLDNFNNVFTVFAIYFVDRKYEVNSWIDIGINFDIFRMYIFNVEFSYFII